MKRLVSLAAALVPLLAASAPSRLTDRDLKALVEGLDKGRARFFAALDSQLKESILRNASGELNVEKFLDDFERNLDNLGDRLKSDYSASAEAQTVLRQASTIDAYLRRQPAGTRGSSEWSRLAADFQVLAANYGAAFPLADGATVRRLTDREVATVLEDVARGAEGLKVSLDADLKKDKALAKPERQAIVAEADQLSKDAKALRSRIEDGAPSSSEAERLLTQATKLQGTLDRHPSPGSAKAWANVGGGLKAVAGAYGSSWPGR